MKNNLYIIILSVLCSFQVSAQEKLSLEEAITRGLEKNFDVRIERKNVEEAGNNNSWGEAGRYPNLSADFNQNNIISDAIETATPFQIQDVTKSRIVNPVARVNWVLFDGFKVNISKRRLAALEQQSNGNATIVLSNTIQAIVLGYYNAVLEKERLREFERQLHLSRDKYEHLLIKRELGGAVTSDLLLEENNYLTDSTNMINQRLNYRNAVRNLNVLLAEEPNKEYEFTNPLQVDAIEYDLSDLVAKMDNGNVDLRKQYITQQIFNDDVRLKKADRYPSLNLNASYGTNRNRIDLSGASFPTQNADGSLSATPGPADPLNSINNTTAINFAVSFDLFRGGKINRAIQNAIIREDVTNIQTEKLKNSLSRDLAESYDRYNIRRQILGINQRKRVAAEQNLELSADKFRNGTISSFNYRTVQNNQLVAAIQELQSVYNLIDSRVSLMRLTGGLIAEFGSEN